MDRKEARKPTDVRPLNRGAPTDRDRRYPIQVRATFVRIVRHGAPSAA
jgi:hypothetical protein